ncbi:tautomerase family protein [Paraburkholderia sp. NPDC080076]|uniref:tautomerase family protein n=1 Tax=Paraburkholderia sp. NPDC080076 TaxID=3390605 RepID=UPI003D06F4FC
MEASQRTEAGSASPLARAQTAACGGGAWERSLARSLAYVHFGLERPGHYKVLYEGRVVPYLEDPRAAAITQSHNEATGAQCFFAQVIFNEVIRGNHFIGGSLLRAEQIFVHGHIRAGCPDDKKQLLLSKIVDSVTKIASVERRSVWVYISEIPALQMIEYGHELPLPGQEEHWLENLPQADREYLLSLG